MIVSDLKAVVNERAHYKDAAAKNYDETNFMISNRSPYRMVAHLQPMHVILLYEVKVNS